MHLPLTADRADRLVRRTITKLDGVTATVSFATGMAAVSFPAAVIPGDLIAAGERAGYRPGEKIPAEVTVGDAVTAGAR